MCKTKYRAPLLIALLGASVCVLAADPAPERASPAVSGEQLENLNRAPPPAAETPRETSASRPAASQAQPPRTPGRNDRLELDTTVVTGNRELPKVLYIVPWKKADLGDLPAQPFNTLLDEVLTPVDRDVFRREVTYYGAVSGGGGAADSVGASPSERSEK